MTNGGEYFKFNNKSSSRYAFFLPVQVDHLRLFLVNFLDEKCSERYIPVYYKGGK